jgi:Na+/H+ antiporter NhaD/arsenite permease-like protein
MLRRCLIVLGAVVAGFGLHSVTHMEPSIVALVGAGVMLLVTRADVSETLREVEWSTLVFFLGLFVMVGGLVHTGVIHTIGSWAAGALGGLIHLGEECGWKTGGTRAWAPATRPPAGAPVPATRARVPARSSP